MTATDATEYEQIPLKIKGLTVHAMSDRRIRLQRETGTVSLNRRDALVLAAVLNKISLGEYVPIPATAGEVVITPVPGDVIHIGNARGIITVPAFAASALANAVRKAATVKIKMDKS